MAEKDENKMKKKSSRKTLMQLQTETTVRDPAAHAKNQITELDKTAKRSLDKRSKCTLQIEEDTKALAQIEEQIQRIKHRFVIIMRL
jgi:predicted  nucleic acid-binding Zn-ribbon protein